MEVNLEVEGKLYCVFIFVARANEFGESPAPDGVYLGRFECLELSPSHFSPSPASSDHHVVIPTAHEVNPSSE